MMVYKAQLLDTGMTYERPKQAYFMDLLKARAWAQLVLPMASDSASVAIFEIREREIESIGKEQIVGRSRDESAIQGL